MIRSGNILDLLQDPSKSYEMKWNIIDKYQWSGECLTDDNRKFQIVIHRPRINDESFWDFEFFLDGEIGITGKGDAFKIMATIIKVALEFLISKDPEILVFELHEASRLRLYQRALREIAFTGYSLYKSVNEDKVYYLAKSEKDFTNG